MLEAVPLVIDITRGLVFLSSAFVAARCATAAYRVVAQKRANLGDHILLICFMYSSVFALVQVRYFLAQNGDEPSVFTFFCLCCALLTQAVWFTEHKRLLLTAARVQVWLQNPALFNSLVDLAVISPEDAERLSDEAAKVAYEKTAIENESLGGLNSAGDT